MKIKIRHRNWRWRH